MREPGLQRRREICDAHGLACNDEGGCVLCRRSHDEGGVPWSWLIALAAVIGALGVWYLEQRPVAWLGDGMPEIAAQTLDVPDALAPEHSPARRAPSPRHAWAWPSEEPVEVVIESEIAEAVVQQEVVIAPAAPPEHVLVVVHQQPPPAVAPPTVIPRAAGGPSPGRTHPRAIRLYRRPDGSGTGELARPRAGSPAGVRMSRSAPTPTERRRPRRVVPR